MLTAFDVGFGVLVLISAILATARGLTREILSLITWAGSAAIAAYMYFKHPEIARAHIADKLVADIATVAVSFIVSLIVLHLLTMRIADFVVDSRVGPLDRTLGFVFGALRGVVIAVVVVLFGVWLVGNKIPDWAAGSQSLPVLQGLGDDLMAALPPNLEQQITSFINHKKNGTTAGTDTGTAAATDDSGDDDSDTPDDSTVTPGTAAPGTAAPAPTTPGTTPAPATPAPAAPAAPAAGSAT
jgi:membrane protein required for colicin V production